MAGSVAGIIAGKIAVQASLDDSTLQKGLQAASDRLKSFGASIGRIGAGIGAAGAAITAPLTLAAQHFADAGSALNDASARTGVSVEALSALSFAAEQTGTDLGTVEGGIRKMQKALVAGSEENLKAEATFLSLGLSVQGLMRQSPEDQFTAIAGALAQIPNPTAKAAAAMQIFGKSGTSLLPLIDDLPALTQKAKELGVVMSTEDATAADALGDSVDALKSVFGAITNTIGSALAPSFTAWNESMARIGKTVMNFISEHKPLIVMISSLGFGLVAAGTAFAVLGTAIYGTGVALGVFASIVGVIGSVFAAIVSPIGLLVTALAGMTAWFLTSTAAGLQTVAFLKGAFSELAADAMSAFQGIADALKAGDIALAGQILWAALKVEWIKGVNFIKSIWEGWKTSAVNAFTDFTFIAATTMTDFVTNLRVGFVTATGFIVDAFTSASGLVKQAWAVLWGSMANIFDTFVANTSLEVIGLVKEIQTQFAIAKSLFTGGGATEAIKAINAQAEAQTAEVQGTLQKRIEARQARPGEIAAETAAQLAAQRQERAGQIAGITQEGAGTKQALFDKQVADLEARRKAEAAGAGAGATELEKAKAEFAALTAQAAEGAAALGTEINPKKAGAAAEAGLSPEGLDKALEQTKAKVDVKGGFSAAALAGLGVGETIQDDQLKEQKGTNQRLDQLTKTVEKKQAVFT